MPIVSHYSEAISIGHGVFKAIFEGLESDVLICYRVLGRSSLSQNRLFRTSPWSSTSTTLYSC